MSYLIKVIDAYRDAHGRPSDASIARSIGVAPQTISSWRTRGIRELPGRATLRRLATFIGEDYQSVVLRAALIDSGWVDEPSDAEQAGHVAGKAREHPQASDRGSHPKGA